MEAFLRLVAEGKVLTDLLTTHRFKVVQATDAYNLILDGGQRYCGVVLEYPRADQPRDLQATQVREKAVAGDQLGISFIGAGGFARGVLLPIVKRSAKVQLLGVGAATGLSARNSADQFGFSYSTTDAQEILEDEKSQIVFIATRHDSHAHLAAEALRREKDVFVEKPLALNEDGLREVVAAARESKGLLMVGYNRRFAPIAQEINERFRVRTGPMTILYRVNAGQLPRDHWTHDPSEGGGRIIGEVCHFIDFVQYLTGALPSSVNAQSVPRTHAAGVIDDSTVISMSLTDGSIASIVYTGSGDPSVPKEHIEVFCDGNVAIVDDFKTGAFVSGGKRTKIGGGAQDKGHTAEITAFLAAARSGTGSPIDLESLIATTLTSFAVVESARTASVVTIDLHSVAE
jgi:predicted dehydrogenase